MHNATQLVGKRFALIVWGAKPNGDDDVAVFAGMLDRRDGQWVLLRDPPGAAFPLPDHWLPRVEPVVPELREMLLGADFCISLSVGDSPAGARPDDFIATGLRWPDDPV